MTTVSPELMRSTGGWALLNQPHCVVSSVAGRRCIFLPSGTGTICRFGSAGPIGGTAWVGGVAGARRCCARVAGAEVGPTPPAVTPGAAHVNQPPRLLVRPPLSVAENCNQHT